MAGLRDYVQNNKHTYETQRGKFYLLIVDTAEGRGCRFDHLYSMLLVASYAGDF